jgi:hypothetical protein
MSAFDPKRTSHVGVRIGPARPTHFNGMLIGRPCRMEQAGSCSPSSIHGTFPRAQRLLQKLTGKAPNSGQGTAMTIVAIGATVS